MEISAAEQLARFITHPIVVSILFSLASLGLVLELYCPGFGIPGIIGLIFSDPLFLRSSGGWTGWLGIPYFICPRLSADCPGNLYYAWLWAVWHPGSRFHTQQFGMGSVTISVGLKSIGIAIVVTIIAIILLGKGLNKIGLWSKLVLEENVSTEEGKAFFEQKSQLVGQVGETLTILRPAGSARINGIRYDVVSDGTFIPQGEKVKVILVEGTRIVVSKLEE